MKQALKNKLIKTAKGLPVTYTQNQIRELAARSLCYLDSLKQPLPCDKACPDFYAQNELDYLALRVLHDMQLGTTTEELITLTIKPPTFKILLNLFNKSESLYQKHKTLYEKEQNNHYIQRAIRHPDNGLYSWSNDYASSQLNTLKTRLSVANEKMTNYLGKFSLDSLQSYSKDDGLFHCVIGEEINFRISELN